MLRCSISIFPLRSFTVMVMHPSVIPALSMMDMRCSLLLQKWRALSRRSDSHDELSLLWHNRRDGEA